MSRSFKAAAMHFKDTSSRNHSLPDRRPEQSLRLSQRCGAARGTSGGFFRQARGRLSSPSAECDGNPLIFRVPATDLVSRQSTDRTNRRNFVLLGDRAGIPSRVMCDPSMTIFLLFVCASFGVKCPNPVAGRDALQSGSPRFKVAASCNRPRQTAKRLPAGNISAGSLQRCGNNS